MHLLILESAACNSDKKVYNNYIMIMFQEEQLPFEQRVKSLQSCVLKYDRYYPSREVEKVFNDILGIRIVIDDYTLFDSLELPKQISHDRFR